MTNEFKDIEIKSLNRSLSRTSDSNTSPMTIVFNLSTQASTEWAELFNNHVDMFFLNNGDIKAVRGGFLEVRCDANKVDVEVLPVIKKVMAETNVAYRNLLNERLETFGKHATKAEREEAKLAELERMFKSD